jgi:Leucine-rich repeat (LRR) protein
VWDQNALEMLVLVDNRLTEVSEQLGQLSNLRMLDLGHNQLMTLPNSIGGRARVDDLSDTIAWIHGTPSRLSSAIIVGGR